MNRRTRIITVSIVVALLLSVGLAAFFFFQSTSAPSQSRQAQTSKTPDKQAQTPQETSVPVKVFYSKHSESDDDPTKVFSVNRTSPDQSVAVFVISQLLAGPSAQELNQGYFSTVKVRNEPSNCNNRDFTVVIKDTVATLRFCRTFDAIGVMSDGQAQETIKASLLQFSTIKKVIVLTKDGNCQFDLSGENLCLM